MIVVESKRTWANDIDMVVVTYLPFLSFLEVHVGKLLDCLPG